MRIAMFTNTYLPHVGGVARSVDSFSKMYQKLGHKVQVAAPEFEEQIEGEKNVTRIPAITDFNGSGFSFRLPAPGKINEMLDRFQPDIIHSHHPFLLGDSALRCAYQRNLPLIFTHHTLYEKYTGYLPVDGAFAQRAAIELTRNYSEACDLVFAPSQSVAELMKEREYKARIEVLPTGIDFESFAQGDGARFRRNHRIDEGAFVIGHVGRLGHEKNLDFLARAAKEALEELENARFVAVGDGDAVEWAQDYFAQSEVRERVLFTGPLEGQELSDAYASFDLFAFASLTETQGLVIAEAMAAGNPVAALDGPGVRDVVESGKNGQLVQDLDDPSKLAACMLELARDQDSLSRMGKNATETARSLSIENTAKKALAHYERILEENPDYRSRDSKTMEDFWHFLDAELELLKAKLSAAKAAVSGPPKPGHSEEEASR